MWLTLVLEGKLPGVRWNWALEFNDTQPLQILFIIHIYFLAELHVF